MNSSTPTATTGREGVLSRSFLALVATQFLGALNDNMFRWIAVPIGKPILGAETSIAVGSVCFVLPYLLLAPLAGYLADRFSKRSVIVWCKVAEVVLMLLAAVAFKLGNVYFLFFVVALMGGQAALFSPAKFGAIPEMLRTESISAGNGLMGMATVVASAGGFVLGYWLFGIQEAPLLTYFGKDPSPEAVAASYPKIWIAAGALVGTAVLGWLTSLFVKRQAAAAPERPMPANPIAETVVQMSLLRSNVPLLRAALGTAFFWGLASLAQMNIDVFGVDVLKLKQSQVGPLGAMLVFGVAIGSVLAGVMSRGRIELGLVPLGALGIAVSACGLFVTGLAANGAEAAALNSAYFWTCVGLVSLGLASGFYSVPLDSYLQHRSEEKTRGQVLAASNFLSFSFILLATGLFWILKRIGLGPDTIFLFFGLFTLPVAVYIFRLLPQATIRFLVWLASLTVYRIRLHGLENIPQKGGAIIVCNHVSWLDGALLLMISSRPIRMVAYADYVEKGFVGWLARTFGVIPIKPEEGPRSILRSLKAAQEAVKNGEIVGIFPEGQITRTGQILPFQRGLMRILEGTGAPIIPAYLDELWGSIFSYSGGKFLWKKPKCWPYPISILFGKPITSTGGVSHVRQAVVDLGVDAMELRKDRMGIPQKQFVRRCRKALFRPKVADSAGTELTGAKALIGTLAFRRVLEREVLGKDEKMVGLLLPPSVGGLLANMAVSISQRVAINLNYTLSDDVVNECIQLAGIKRVLTSRMFLMKKPMKIDAELVYLEDLKTKITKWDKAVAAFQTFALPSAVIEWLHGLNRVKPDDLMTVIFTSGSTGVPKGVMLSHANVMSNTQGVDQIFHIKASDVFLGVLPFFHSFGFTGTMWLPMVMDAKAVYHYNPLDARTVGKLVADHGVTITMATPTFLRSYIKRCDKEQFKTLDLVVVGAEKLPLDLAKEFHDKYGIYPVEGYGTTELSPVAAVNIPDHRSGGGSNQIGTKLGTVGRPLPGVSARVVDAETGAVLADGNPGLLQIRGPNVMQGYLNMADKTAEVVTDGWYNTGDMARIDEDGFIEITGRLSRFSKIGGEMVPHIRIEEVLMKATDDPTDTEGLLRLAVTAVPDPRKGERLIVLHRPLKKRVDEILRELSAAGLPNLWIPDADCFFEVDAIPILGTGKLDLRGIKDMAVAKTSPQPAAVAS
jgi:acyl-[acyl-carrier-protein]-phospholipid O-acyltransferase/long-chain-fatty-acid--[acyl-carrier-protein] ligase